MIVLHTEFTPKYKTRRREGKTMITETNERKYSVLKPPPLSTSEHVCTPVPLVVVPADQTLCVLPTWKSYHGLVC